MAFKLEAPEIARRRSILARHVADGGSVEAAADEIGVSAGALKNFIEKHAWDLRPSGPKVDPAHPLAGLKKGEAPEPARVAGLLKD